MEIKEHTAMITGGASGLGAATARLLHKMGGNVLLLDMAEGPGEELAGELGEGRALFIRTDVRDPEQTGRAAALAVDKFGGLHFAVNCAGIADAGRVLGREGPMALEYFKRVVEVNLIGSFNTIRLAAEQMLGNDPNDEGERGVVINTASVAAYEGQIGQAPYAASKGGIVSMTLPIAREFAQHGIRVVTIAPGLFDTNMLGNMPEEVRESLAAQVPFPRRLGRPDEYAAMVATVIGSPMLNGETIRLDGAIRLAPR